jgi:hypothetical protein
MPLDYTSEDSSPRAVVMDRVRALHMDGLVSAEIVERLMDEFVPPAVSKKIGGEDGLLYSVLIAGFRNLVTQANCDMRQDVWRGKVSTDDDSLDIAGHQEKEPWRAPAGVGLSFVKALRFLSSYDFPLLGGGRLGDATIEDIDACINKCEARINGAQKHKDMLLRVRAKMEKRRDGARVRDVIPDKTLAAMIADVPREIP